MGQQVKELFDWARRRKLLASFFVALTLVVGILIGSVVSGRVSAMKTFTFAGTNASKLAVPDPIPSAASFSGIVNRVEPAVVNIATTQVLERKNSVLSLVVALGIALGSFYLFDTVLRVPLPRGPFGI